MDPSVGAKHCYCLLSERHKGSGGGSIGRREALLLPTAARSVEDDGGHWHRGCGPQVPCGRGRRDTRLLGRMAGAAQAFVEGLLTGSGQHPLQMVHARVPAFLSSGGTSLWQLLRPCTLFRLAPGLAAETSTGSAESHDRQVASSLDANRSADWASTGYECRPRLWTAEQAKNTCFPVSVRS